uniref:Pancreatic trypsin inhibitor n=1 Tax=Rhipicephalus appendiculatus TaxID=34631 RepID=A0A131Z901_RHIAP
MSSMECIAQNEFLGHLGRTMPYLLMVFMASVCVSCLVVGVRGLPEVCEEPPNARTGTMNCTGSVTKWYFSKNLSVCMPHHCGGYEKTYKGFVTEGACKRGCVKLDRKKRPQPSCWERPQQGRCKASFSKYFWNDIEGCVMYNGCYRQGFLNIDDCRKKCGDLTLPHRPRPRDRNRERTRRIMGRTPGY